MPFNKSSNFAGQNFYLGLDVHKRSWSITVRTLGLEVAHFTQSPDAGQLCRYLNNKYPAAHFISAYEAGFCGTSPHDALRQAGIENIIIHAADLPQTNKHRNNKTDLYDSRALARYLEAGLLKPIHIMASEQQENRALFRLREAKVKDVTRCSNRLRSCLYYFGVELPERFRDKEYLCKGMLQWMGAVQLQTPAGTSVVQQYINDLSYHRQQLLQVTRKLRKAIMDRYGPSYDSLLTVPGIGSITAMALLAETGDLRRFDQPGQFASYLGLIPAEQSTGDTLTRRAYNPDATRT